MTLMRTIHLEFFNLGHWHDLSIIASVIRCSKGRLKFQISMNLSEPLRKMDP